MSTGIHGATRRRKPVLEKSRAVRVGRFHTRLIECGGAGPTVLLLHGFSDSADSWRAVMTELTAANHRAVAYDLPHFGRAERVEPADGYIPMLDEFVAAAVHECDRGEGVVLVGNSVGALLALRAAASSALPIRAAVAIGPVGVRPVLWHTAARRAGPLLRPLIRPTMPVILQGTVTGPRMITEGFALAVASGRLTADAKAEYGSHWGPGDLRRQLMMGGRMLDELAASDLIPWSALQVPTTLVWGRQDWVAPAPRHRRLPAGATDHIAIRMLPNTGHCPQYDHPREIFELIASTCDELQPAVAPEEKQA